MAYRLIFTREARDQLDAIYDFIAEAASPDIARRFTDGIVDRLTVLSDFPRIGTPRDDIRGGLRTLAYRRRITIALMVEDTTVVVIGFYYGGQDFETLLRDEQP
ncbi:type II toxin-antitoxin system RelE/ParE family toxin [Sphingomonas lycopersici]|uniref:Type II toxin-antitoxin system RelE/ParE family toxin n=1 Tax=Sphingomonas lycopersici TaxID=2951807 RepID=A0AA41ZAU1_9SPHN|nr:type II toxin-antitoxin system RelE/ParE family toxin [Sphingomonas lycopersici]MCW6532516.1 type II toxin-antitoxin system RelE/ParE family toxin [Sphingomonas lycopersici]MCW6535786.1 type II toxin-antitoxin system RelE/ParE family toxin [Sphingomonas lycopersici]